MAPRESNTSNKIPLKVLVIEDSAFDAQILQAKLLINGYRPNMKRVDSLAAFREALISEPWDIIISDYFMPNVKMMDTLTCLKEQGLDIPFIIVSGGIGDTEAVAAMKAGASDYILKNNLSKLGAVVERELREAQIRHARHQAETALRDSESRYRTLWETSQDALLIINSESNTIFLSSPATEKIFGYKGGFLQGKSLSILQKPELFPNDMPLSPDCQGTTRAIHKNGKIIDIEVRSHKITLSHEDFFVLDIRDITEWKFFQEQQLKNKEQLRIAKEIHQSLYPPASPNFPGYDIAGISFPAEEIGGDYFDFFSESDISIDIAIGDVTGHGLGPAILVSETRAYLRILSHNQKHLNEILSRTNEVLASDLAGTDRYVTLTLLRLFAHPSAFFYANAGHTAGFILNSVGEIKQKLSRTGIVLGRKKDSVYKQSDFSPLEEGDLLILITDGLQEVFSPEGEMFGVERILDVIRQNLNDSSINIIHKIYQAGLDFSKAEALDDDFTCIIIKVLST